MVNSNPVDEETKLDRAAAHQVVRRLAHMLRPYRRQVILATVVLVLQTACLLAGPALVRAGVDVVVDRVVVERGPLPLAQHRHMVADVHVAVLGLSLIHI